MAEIATPQLDQYLKDWQAGGQKRKENLDKFVDRPFPPMPRVAHSSDEIAALGLDPQKFALWGDRSTDPGDIAAAQKARDGIKKLHSDINMLLDRAKQRDGTNTTFKVVAGIVTFLGSFGTAVATAYEGHNDIKFVGALVTAFAAFITMGADVLKTGIGAWAGITPDKFTALLVKVEQADLMLHANEAGVTHDVLVKVLGMLNDAAGEIKAYNTILKRFG